MFVKIGFGQKDKCWRDHFEATWPCLLVGRTMLTVGLVAMLISFSSNIAADTFAFIGGKALGRTLLTAVSPKKTWEGVFVGLGGCVATSVLLTKCYNFWVSQLVWISFW